jgi:hypothetical protein
LQQDYQRLLTTADGIIVPTPPGFQRQSTPPPLRASYQAVSAAVHKMYHNQFLENQVFILPVQTALRIPDIHFSCQHWIPKKLKDSGRNILDAKNGDLDTNLCINKDSFREIFAQQYGEIHHPTLQRLVRMVETLSKNIQISVALYGKWIFGEPSH